MAIDFPEREANLSPEDEFLAYKHLVDSHLHFIKQQSKCEFFYWKGLAAFFLLSICCFLLYGIGIFISPLVGIVLIGMAALLLFFQNVRRDFEYGTMAKSCIEKGLLIEKNHDYTAKLFKNFEDNKLSAYHGNLLSRLFPIGLIMLATSGAATLLAAQTGGWIAIAMIVLSLAVLYMTFKSYIKTARRILLGN